MLLTVGIIFCPFALKAEKGSYVFYKQKSSNLPELLKDSDCLEEKLMDKRPKRRKLLKEGVKMLEFIIGIFVGAFIGVVFMCLFNAAAKADEQMKDNIDDKK